MSHPRRQRARADKESQPPRCGKCTVRFDRLRRARTLEDIGWRTVALIRGRLDNPAVVASWLEGVGSYLTAVTMRVRATTEGMKPKEKFEQLRLVRDRIAWSIRTLNKMREVVSGMMSTAVKESGLELLDGGAEPSVDVKPPEAPKLRVVARAETHEKEED